MKIVKITQTLPAFPSQWDAWTDEGKYIYIRYRWGYLRLSEGVQGETIYSAEFGHELDGVLTQAELFRELAANSNIELDLTVPA